MNNLTVLVLNFFKVARVEQTETPEQLQERSKGPGKKDKVVRRLVLKLRRWILNFFVSLIIKMRIVNVLKSRTLQLRRVTQNLNLQIILKYFIQETQNPVNRV